MSSNVHRQLPLAMRFAAIAILLATAAWGSFGGQEVAASTSCGGLEANSLDTLFRGQAGRLVGGDYVRAYALPGGNTLFAIQDAFLAASDTASVAYLGNAQFVHNAALLVDANGCVQRTMTGSRSYIGDASTTPLSRWFWAMGGDMGTDGLLHVMVAEMRNPNGTGAATGATPVATWHASIDPISLDVRSFTPATNSGADLYGWAVTSDSMYSYLYAYCNRQFVPGTLLGHDPACSARVRVGRVPRGQFNAPMEYFAGDRWRPESTSATPIAFPGQRTINPVSIQYRDGQFVSVSKEGDWWGSVIYVDMAASPVGPWTNVATLTPVTKCPDCNTYYASLMPWRQQDGSVVIGLSNNAWNMGAVAFPNPWIYRTSFMSIHIDDAIASAIRNRNVRGTPPPGGTYIVKPRSKVVS